MQKLPIDPLRLTSWFREHRRELPWRKSPTPYQVWVSEVMLQQTQVAVVIPYYEKWMRRFPSIADLAAADVDEVIKLWEGLGYYSRARNLHRAAQYLMEFHGGELPDTSQELERVIGLGPYTIGAILSFAFHQKAAAVDGNVVRVLSRYTALEEVVCLPRVQKKIREYAQEVLPDSEPWVVAEALIELGATVCTRDPKCYLCPLSGTCAGLKRGIADLLPRKKEKKAVEVLERHVAILVCDGHLLLRKGKKGGVMADLYEFPYFDSPEDQEQFLKTHGVTAVCETELDATTHTFTRFRAKLYPKIWKALARIEIPDYDWIAFHKISHLPFSAGHRRILRDYAHFTH